jgi:ADP-ribosylglycohydrolase
MDPSAEGPGRDVSTIVQAAALCILIPEHANQIAAAKSVLGTGSPDKDNLVLLWLAIVDGVIHNMTKKQLFKAEFYKHLPPKTLQFLKPDTESAATDSLEETIYEVIHTFRCTNNFTEGLYKILDQSLRPDWSATLYGQLAGAYYGLTDIPETWMDYVQDTKTLLAARQNYV